MLFSAAVIGCTWTRTHSQLNSSAVAVVPGMNHCKGGPGANVFDMLTPLVQWVEDDIAPERVIATHYVNNNPAQGVQFTRPLCPYPKEAEYKGGNTNDAATFVRK